MSAILSMDLVQQKILPIGSKPGAGTNSSKVTWLTTEHKESGRGLALITGYTSYFSSTSIQVD
jgi:hypothetical protein